MLTYIILPSLIIVAISLSLAIGCVSAYSVVKKWSLVGDVISHAAFPGIICMFFFSKTHHTILLFIGGFISSLISIMISFYLFKKNKLPKDTAFALTLASFFACGIIGMSIIQKKHIVGQSILNNFIYGNLITFAMNNSNFYIIISIAIAICFISTISIQKIISFDRQFALSKMNHITKWEFLFLSLSISCIVIGLQAIGILLMSSLIILPGTTARLLTNSYQSMMIISIIITCLSFLSGILLSYNNPSVPTGPLIVLSASSLFLLTIIITYIKKKMGLAQ